MPESHPFPPSLSLGSEIVGLPYRPLFPATGSSSKNYRIVPAAHVTAASGTGLVHCAPAHGVEDYNAFRALGLLPRSAEMTCHVDKAGRFMNEITEVLGQERGQRLVGLEVLSEGGEAMVEVLRGLKPRQGGGRLVHEGKTSHRYPYDWKTGKPLITL
jgi:isoleucyl-tRNA synthetase